MNIVVVLWNGTDGAPHHKRIHHKLKHWGEAGLRQIHYKVKEVTMNRVEFYQDGEQKWQEMHCSVLVGGQKEQLGVPQDRVQASGNMYQEGVKAESGASLHPQGDPTLLCHAKVSH